MVPRNPKRQKYRKKSKPASVHALRVVMNMYLLPELLRFLQVKDRLSLQRAFRCNKEFSAVTKAVLDTTEHRRDLLRCLLTERDLGLYANRQLQGRIETLFTHWIFQNHFWFYPEVLELKDNILEFRDDPAHEAVFQRLVTYIPLTTVEAVMKGARGDLSFSSDVTIVGVRAKRKMVFYIHQFLLEAQTWREAEKKWEQQALREVLLRLYQRFVQGLPQKELFVKIGRAHV